jgi:trigger factor
LPNMDIIKENIDELNAVVKIKVTPADYEPGVEKTVRSYQKKASIPGFRPGKVPVGVIKKMYGKSILADELNKLLQDSLNDYIQNNELRILGQPLPRNNEINWDAPSDLEFAYDLGLSPVFALQLPVSETFYEYTVEIDDEYLQKNINDLRRRFGVFSRPEVASDGDVLFGDFEELNSDGSVREGGIKASTTLAIDFIADDHVRSQFRGLEKDESVVFNPTTAIGNVTEIASMLSIEKQAAESLVSDFRFTLKNIHHIELADLNAEFYDKILGAGMASTQEEFEGQLRMQISSSFHRDTDRVLFKEITDKILATNSIPLPDDFLKRFIQATNEKPVTMEQIEKEYEQYAKSVKWSLVESRIMQENKMEVNREEIESYAEYTLRDQLSRYGYSGIDDDRMKEIVNRHLEERKNVEKALGDITAQKVFDYLKLNLNIEKKAISYQEFITLHV